MELPLAPFAVGLVLGAVLGAALAGLLLLVRAGRAREEAARAREALGLQLASAQQRMEGRERQLREQDELLDKADSRLRETFKALGGEALSRNSEEFLKLATSAFGTLMASSQGDLETKRQAIEHLVQPIRELLDRQAKAVSELETRREGAYRGVEEQIKAIAASHLQLGAETSRLVSALRRPEQRGRWGELQLRNCVELAGMTARCDFDEQASVAGDGGKLRPDMTVRLPGGGVIVVDSKVALDAYLDALQPDGDRDSLLHRHAGQVDQHWRRLAAKEYWKQFPRAPQVVVMFMPLESALVAALEVRPDLHAQAMADRVCIATPTLLVGLLRAIAYGWQQESVAVNAREIASAGAELHERILVFLKHQAAVGKALGTSVAAYNESVGSLERMVMPSARRLKALGATVAKDVEGPTPLEGEVREITASSSLPSAASSQDDGMLRTEAAGGPAEHLG